MKKITFDQLVKHFGGKTEIAKILKITPQAVTNWGSCVPPGAAIKLEKASGGKVKAVAMPVNLNAA